MGVLTQDFVKRRSVPDAPVVRHARGAVGPQLLALALVRVGFPSATHNEPGSLPRGNVDIARTNLPPSQ